MNASCAHPAPGGEAGTDEITRESTQKSTVVGHITESSAGSSGSIGRSTDELPEGLHERRVTYRPGEANPVMAVFGRIRQK